MQIRDRVVLITGASQGVGAACAVEFARFGAKLSLTARSEAGMRQAGGADALITAGDLTDAALQQLVVDRTVERFGRIDILINNAGVGLYKPSWNAPMDEMRAMMEVNFFAPLGLAQRVIPGMRARRSGMIVNVGSIGGKIPLPWLPIYCASKYALGCWSEGLAMELRRDGVRSMIVCPGYVKTKFQQNVLGGTAPEKLIKSRKFAITPEKCAHDIRRGVERDAHTVMTPWAGWFAVAGMRLFPGLIRAQMAKTLENG